MRVRPKVIRLPGMTAEEFLRDAVLKHNPTPGGINSFLPVLALDECVNRPIIHRTVEIARKSFLAINSADLWAQLREGPDRTKVLHMGTLDRGPRPPGSEVGPPVKHWSWPDWRIAWGALVHLHSYDRVVLLSENTRNDEGGLRRILATEIGPALEMYNHGRFGMLAFMKNGKTTWKAYCEALLRRLAGERVRVGFEYIRV